MTFFFFFKSVYAPLTKKQSAFFLSQNVIWSRWEKIKFYNAPLI